MRPTLLALVLAACAGDHGELAPDEWSALAELANPPDPPRDRSNKAEGDPAAERLGQMLYFDGQLSGPAQLVDMLGRPTPFARAAAGVEIDISCATCHNPAAGGADHSSTPRHVSIGAGAYDVNGQQTLNAAYWPLLYWNGRVDSLWSQAVSVIESEVSMGGDRMKVVWRLADAYREAYAAAFPEWPLPALMDSVAAQRARLLPDGTCKLEGGACPTDRCQTVTAGAITSCLPRFPLRGRPGYEGQVGYVDEGTFRRCQRGQATSPAEPWDDAYDCMDLRDQKDVTRIYVNAAKAIAAYEARLLSRNSAFDRFMAGDDDALSPSARRGARLFVGKAACNDCHGGPLLSDGKFHDIGIPQAGPLVPSVGDCPRGGWCDCESDDLSQPSNCLPLGQRDGLRKLAANRFRRDSFYSDDGDCQRQASLHNDPGYAAQHPDECGGRVGFYSVLRVDDVTSRGRWRTPSLRDVALTAPYMHDGLYDTLEDVVWHYSDGARGLPPLHLDGAEVSDLVAFLRSLTGAALPAELTHAPALPPKSPF